MTNETRGLTASELLRVLPKLDPTRSDPWKRKIWLIEAIGSWGVPYAISEREAGAHANCSPHTAMRLIEELIEARVLLVVALGAGQRPTTYVVNRDLHQWGTTSRGRLVGGKVPWTSSLAEVRLWAFHVEPPPGAEQALSRASGPLVDNKRKSSRGGASRPRDNDSPPRARGPETRDKRRPARGVRAALARQLEEAAQEGSPPVVVELSSPPLSGAPRGGGKELRKVDRRFAELAQLVVAAARGPWIGGEPLDDLADLYRAVGADQILEWLHRSPVVGVPRMVEWLVDQQHAPDPEELEQLRERERARAEAEVIAAGGDLGGPSGSSVLEEFRGFDHQRDDENQTAAARQAAREALRNAPSENEAATMETATGGAA